jgi:two-component system, chemotaxis family, CheB/CheR fusion protein
VRALGLPGMTIFRGRKARPSPNRSTNVEEARLWLAAIVESSDDAVIGKDVNGVITSWNAAAARIFGYAAEEIVGCSGRTLIPPELRDEELGIRQKLQSGERVEHYATRRRRKDGTPFDVSLTISPVKDAAGRIIGFLKIARDLSDRKRAEAALVESQRFAAAGRMAAAIAHEVNNPLEAITNLAYLLTTNSSLNEEARGFARMLLDEVGRASRVTKQTLTYFRESNEPAPVRLPELLDNLLQLHRQALMKKHIRVRKLYCDDDGTVRGVAAELGQVFANLILNALDALPVGGTLSVKVARHGSEMVRVAVADNGSGITEERRRRLFEPFLTSKPGRGTGLGLWVSDGIVRKYGGRIRVTTSTRPSHSGTVFTVLLPSYFATAEKTSVA